MPEPSKPPQQIEVVTLVDRQSEIDSPVYYANHAMVRATAEEVFTTFYLRKMHCLESPGESGQASETSPPLCSVFRTPSVWLRR